MTPGAGASVQQGHGAVHPLTARIVRPQWAAHVVSPMLESLGAVERVELLRANPDSYLNVTRSGADFDQDMTIADVRTADAAALQRLMSLGAYDDAEPAMYVYRLRDAVNEHTGVVAEVDTHAFVTGEVRGHESVDSSRVEGLVRHFAVVPARSELVALLHTAGPEAAAIVKATCAEPPILEFSVPGGPEQSVWRVHGERRTAALAAELSRGPHYIADGHHRVAASLREWEQAGRPARSGVMCVLYAPDELDLRAFHRRVAGPVDSSRLLAELGRDFTVGQPARGPGGGDRSSFRVYVCGRWYDVSYDEPRDAGVAGLDVSLLHNRVLGPVLGIQATADTRLEMVPERTPVSELTSRCDADGGALFLLRAPGIEALTSIADQGEVMMAKTTYFEPKPRAGIFVRVDAEAGSRVEDAPMVE
ncbi:MAG: DUF1015 family protein, partial [Nocardioidaceae bacterium]